ncbi:MAG: hypothetical protein KA763_00470 [Xanthomonadales bacterium]|nr:hypothetical protein [Xanthomonadales bacterium]
MTATKREGAKELRRIPLPKRKKLGERDDSRGVYGYKRKDVIAYGDAHRELLADLLEAAQWARIALHDYPCEARDRLDAAINKAGAGSHD